MGKQRVGRNRAMDSDAFVLAAADGKTECSEGAENAEGAAGRINAACTGALSAGETGFSFGRAAATAALCITRGVTFDFDLEKALQISNAFVELIPDVHVLTVAKQGAVRLAACRCASTLQIRFARDEALGLAIDLAVHVRVGVARTIAAGIAFRLAIGARRRCFAASFALTCTRGVTGCFATGVGGAGAT
jgi:hypothetical protein